MLSLHLAKSVSCRAIRSLSLAVESSFFDGVALDSSSCIHEERKDKGRQGGALHNNRYVLIEGGTVLSVAYLRLQVLNAILLVLRRLLELL